MAKVETEAQFVALWLHEARLGKDTALKIMTHIRPAMFEYEQIGDAYQYLIDRYAKGLSLDDLESEAELLDILGQAWLDTILDEAERGGRIGDYVRSVLFNYRARRQAAFLAEAAEQAAKLVGVSDQTAVDLANTTIAKLSTFHTTQGDLDKPVTRDEITERARVRLVQRGKNTGVAMPYSKLSDHTGNLIPGDLVVVAGYSNSGKSLFAANLFRHFVTNGTPVIAFPTEMGLAWHARAVAAHAQIPQMLAEREQWESATQQQLEAYEFGLQDLGKCPWELVDKPSISPEEIMARASVLRRKFSGRTVVVMVDHMHRLNYGREEANFAIGRAIKEMRNWIRQDEEGGMIAVCLAQPKKPFDDLELYRPVDGHKIRGVSEVWNEIDFLFSPYRRWVKTDPAVLTPWGTPGTKYTKDGFPEFAVPNKDEGKVDDEHVYVKIGKRRVGGEGPTVMLNIEAPSGHIFQIERPKLAVVGARA